MASGWATIASGFTHVGEQADYRGEAADARSIVDSQNKHCGRFTRVRVPSIRVKGSDTPYIIIPGRKAERGEKVVPLAAGQTWTYADPPITIRCETDSESDMLEIAEWRKSQKRHKTEEGYRYGELHTDSGKESGSELPNSKPMATSNVGNKFDRKGNRSGDEPDLLGLYDHDQEYVGTFRTAYRYTEPVNRFSSEVEPNSEVAKEQATMGEQKKEIGGAQGYKVDMDLDISMRFAVPTEKSTESADDLDMMETTSTGGKWKEFFQLQGKESAIAAGEDVLDLDLPGSEYQRGETSELVNLFSLDPRTRINKLRKMFDERRRLEEDMYTRKRVASAANGSDLKRNRSDLRAFTYVERRVQEIPLKGTNRIMGEVPGTEVGDYFFYRIELLLVGIHRQIQGGIDFISASAKKIKYRDTNGKPLSVAVSVVSSQGGKYENTYDGDTLIYTGQGENHADQKMVRGNLALKNSYDLGLSVRVIRRVEVTRREVPVRSAGCPGLGVCSPSGFLYIYDGLYKVEDFCQVVGSHGSKVWKFKLVRRPGQKSILNHLKDWP